MEFWGCDPAIDDADAMERALHAAVAASGATLLHLHVHAYSPQGITGVAVLAESHFAVHSWPEHGYLAADLFTCGDHTDSQAAVDVLQRAFSPARVEVQTISRGVRIEAVTQAKRA